MTKALGWVALLFLTATAQSANAHPLAPSSLKLVERDDGTIEQRFRSSATRPVGTELVPLLPRGCESLEPPRVEAAGSAVDATAKLRCEGGLAGKKFAVRGLAESGTNVVWQVTRADGTSVQGLLHGTRNHFEIPARERPAGVFVDYLRLGIEHLMTGLDHVLFVLSLLFVLRGRGALALAVTAFTLGHSTSLALAALDIVRLPQGPVEIAIAATLLFAALEILRRHHTGHAGGLERHPALLSALFGLVHGLGFAGVLTAAGVPARRVLPALIGFNTGIEIGQLALIAAALAFASLARRAVPKAVVPWRMGAAYVTGSLAAMWILERALVLAVS